MDLLKTILFILASVGVVNGLALTGFIWLKKEKSIAELYFSGLVLMLCIRIGKSIYYYFAEEIDLLILQLGLSACIFIGPFFFLFAKAALQKATKPPKKDLWLLFILAISITGVGTIFPYRSFPEIWNGKIVLGIYLVWLFFVLAGLWVLTPLWNKWKEKKAVFTQSE